MVAVVELDGAQGEGGGQIIRTALSLSMYTGRPFRIVNIRAWRHKPGLRRQHLTAVQAAAAICGAEVEGDRLGSRELRFAPGSIRGGDYRFDIGTAGSCTLVFQTVLPALLLASAPSHIELQGGTHNPMAPPFQFLERAFLPLLQRMGTDIALDLKRFGFYPEGGGEFSADIRPVTRLKPLSLDEPGSRLRAYAESFIAALPMHIAQRELDVVRKRLGWNTEQLHLHGLPNDLGPGNALLITLEQQFVTEVFSGFGEKGVTAETVAEQTAAEAAGYIASGAAVGPHLADQLLLPMALAGAGSFTASTLSRHTVTNADVIRQFLDLPIRFERPGRAVRIVIGREG